MYIDIAICDDEIAICNQLEQYITDFLTIKEIDFHIDIFTSGDTLLDALSSENYDLIFQDIELSGINGIETAAYIRNTLHNDAVQIVYISAVQSYAMKLFESRPMHFLVKPLTYDAINGVLKTFLGYKPECKKTSLALYALFFIFENTLSYSQIFGFSIISYYMNGYINFALYTILFIIIIFISFCYKPTLSTGLSSGTLSALSLYCSIPVAKYIFDTIYLFVVPNFDIFNNASAFRHICYLIFEKYQNISIYSLGIIIKLLFLFAVLRVKHIYDERNMYYLQASRQQKNNLELKQFRHDIKNHMGALNQMLASDEEEKALAYLSTLNEMVDSSQLFSHTGNVALDSIVNYKLFDAERNKITCTFHAAIPENLDLNDKDIIIILGNLLDNAMDACSHLENNRYIHTSLTYHNGLLLIQISNSYNGIIKKSGRKLATLKADKSLHGLGLKNVQTALNAYNGTLEINVGETEFNVSAIMYVNQAKTKSI